MVGQGWLEPVEIEAGNGPLPGYRLTDRARLRLDQAGTRIYRTDTTDWDGRWHVRVLAPITERSRRERIRSQLRFLGMAPVSDSTWVSPHPSVEVDQLLRDEDLDAVCLTSSDVAPVPTLLDAFDVARLGRDYETWLAEARRLVARGTPGS